MLCPEEPRYIADCYRLLTDGVRKSLCLHRFAQILHSIGVSCGIFLLTRRRKLSSTRRIQD